MNKMTIKIVLLFIGSLLTMGISAQAQTTTVESRVVYYMAADANGVQQVYQQILDGDARQITYADSDVITFGAAHDGLSIAYITDGQLLLQPIHTEEPIALATVSAEQFFGEPLYSPDNQYIAYPDNGIWLLDLGTREAQKILENVAMAEDGSNMADFRFYLPTDFLADENGVTTHLMVKIGIWEWRTAGLYDLATGELQELTGHIHTDILPLSNGMVLRYGNNGVDGQFSLSLAPDIVDINGGRQVLSFSELTDATLFAEQAVEIAPAKVRIFGTALEGIPVTVSSFYFDYNVETDQASELHFISCRRVQQARQSRWNYHRMGCLFRFMSMRYGQITLAFMVICTCMTLSPEKMCIILRR